MGKKVAVSLKKGPSPRYLHILGKSFEDDELVQIADEMYEWFLDDQNYWLKDFCISRMFGTKRISEFAKRSDYFRQMLGVCKDMQESKLVKIGFAMQSPTMAIFALKNVAGWRNEGQLSDGTDEKEYEDE